LKGQRVLYHIVFWLGLYALWIIIFRSYSLSIGRTLTIQFCYLIFITADFYLINDLIVPKFLKKKTYFLFSAFVILAVAISAWLRSLIAMQMSRKFFHEPALGDFGSVYIASFLNIAIWILAVTVAKMILERIDTEKRLDLLEKQRIKNELAFLKAQINPHTLFNSLNTVYGHIEKTNQAGRNILLQYSELLRYQLYECSEEKVSLGKEIEYLKNYIAFERLRKDGNLNITFLAEQIDPTLYIAPLLLVVPIENAFKYVSHFADQENQICIEISTNGKFLYATISNTIEIPTMPGHLKKTGVGIANLKRRLELLYQNKFEFSIKKDNKYFASKLIIELK
jgi:two-component system, LytTR family, sensor kinase